MHVLQITQLKHVQCEAQAIQCDVSNDQQQQEVFDRHMQRFGVLDIAILNAGIGEKGTHACRFRVLPEALMVADVIEMRSPSQHALLSALLHHPYNS